MFPTLARVLDRLHRGDRWWPAEVLFRTVGLALLGGCRKLALAGCHMAARPGLHPSALIMAGVSTAIVALLTCGLALAIGGPGLLRLVPDPLGRR